MNTISLLSQPVVVALGYTLLHALWQGFALVLPAAVLLHLLRRQSSLVRYRIAVAALFGQVLASTITFALYYQPASAVSSLPAPTPATGSLQRVWLSVVAEAPLSWQQAVRLWLDAHLTDVVLLWLVGVAVFGLRLLGGWAYVQRLKTTATQPASTLLINTMNRLAGELNLRRVVQLRESVRVAVPVVVGILKPVVLLPVGLVAGLSMAEVEAVLAHELAHVRRNDFLVNLVQSVVEVLYFFHPALWWLSARVREERENCCDDLAISVCGDGRTLARALAQVEAFRLVQQTPAPALAMAFSSPKKQLLHRVRRVLGVSIRPAISNGSLAGLTLATLLVLGLSAYAVAQEQRAKQSHAQMIRPKPARRYKIDQNSEFATSNDNRLSYIIWKGQRLSKASVARLQRALDNSLAGLTNLDNVPQPDRDILLTVIEKTNSFKNGMDALATGLAQIDYNNIVADAVSSVSALNYDKIVNDAMASVHLIDSIQTADGWIQLHNSHDSLPVDINVNVNTDLRGLAVMDALHQRQQALQRQKVDSLSRLMNQQHRQTEARRLQIETHRFQIEQLERQTELLNWKKNKLNETRQELLGKQRNLMNSEDKKLAQTDVEKQISDLEQKITAQEKAITELNTALEAMNNKIREARQPMDALESQIEKIEGVAEQYSEQMNRYADAMTQMYMSADAWPKAARIRTPRLPRVLVRPHALNGLVAPIAPLPAPRPAAAPRPVPVLKPAPLLPAPAKK